MPCGFSLTLWHVSNRIQAAARRKAAKATVDAIRYQKQVEHNAAVSIQCFWRRKMAERALERRKAARRLEKRRSAALEIQVRASWLHSADLIRSV
jgi:hypothetical protein